jgi:hypothetical protein
VAATAKPLRHPPPSTARAHHSEGNRFHALRKAGNSAVREAAGDRKRFGHAAQHDRSMYSCGQRLTSRPGWTKPVCPTVLRRNAIGYHRSHRRTCGPASKRDRLTSRLTVDQMRSVDACGRLHEMTAFSKACDEFSLKIGYDVEICEMLADEL